MENLVICNESDLVVIADAIRAATKSSETFTVPQLSTTASTLISKLRRA